MKVINTAARSLTKWTCFMVAAIAMVHCRILPGRMVTDRMVSHGALHSELPEERMNVSEMIRYFGYPVEEHSIVTEDGYILSAQRIPYGRKGAKGTAGVVFLQHGLLSSAADWVMNFPDQSLGFILADHGFDVWLGNSRGNTYSNKHVNLTENDDAFWAFSFDEMAKYDLPAFLNYILKVTEQKQLYYGGHSQGTLMAFAEFGRNQELAKKVKVFFALAPVATVGHIKGAMKVLSYFAPELEFLVKILGIHDFLPSNHLVKFLAAQVCGHDLTEPVCANILFLLCGFDTKNLNETRLPIYFSHTPAGTSVRDVVHFAQMVRAKKMQMYDYGYLGNLKHYHQSYPPQYNLTSMTVPTVLFTATEDWLADPQDVEFLTSQLPSILKHKNIEEWNHLDFIWGIDANKLIYQDILAMMEKYEHTVRV